MTLRQFRIQLSRLPNDAELRWLFTRCSDVCVVSSLRRDVATVFVDRHAPSTVDAIVSVIRDLDTVGVIPVTVLPDEDLVTIELLAERAGVSAQAARAWAERAQAPGQFPAPVAEGLFRWSEVARWLRLQVHGEGRSDAEDDLEPTFTAVNLALRLRALAPQVERIAAIRGLLSG